MDSPGAHLTRSAHKHATSPVHSPLGHAQFRYNCTALELNNGTLNNCTTLKLYNLTPALRQSLTA